MLSSPVYWKQFVLGDKLHKMKEGTLGPDRIKCFVETSSEKNWCPFLFRSHKTSGVAAWVALAFFFSYKSSLFLFSSSLLSALFKPGEREINKQIWRSGYEEEHAQVSGLLSAMCFGHAPQPTPTPPPIHQHSQTTPTDTSVNSFPNPPNSIYHPRCIHLARPLSDPLRIGSGQ